MHPRPNAFPRPSLCNLSSCRPLVLTTILLLFGLPSGGCSPEPALEDEEPQAWVDLALDSGDPAYLENELGILEALIIEIESAEESYHSILISIFEDHPIELHPGAWAQHISPRRLEDSFTLIQGQAGYSLAAFADRSGSRSAAFGFELFGGLSDGSQAGFETPFERLLLWLLHGDTSGDIGAPDVAIAGLGGATDTAESHLLGLSDGVELRACASPSEDQSCFEGLDLLVLGDAGSDESEQIEAYRLLVSEAVASKVPILFIHTSTWATNSQGEAIVDELGFSYGGYGGNYWSEDSAEWPSVESMIDAGGGSLGSLGTMAHHFVNEDFDIDWTQCTTYVGQTSCSDVPELRSGFLAGAETLKGLTEYLDRSGIDLFAQPGQRLSKLALLLADWYRQGIEYPMNKDVTEDTDFLRAYYADHVVHYRRSVPVAQPDLGTFSDSIRSEDVSLEDGVVSVEVSGKGGFTAIGRYALPGHPFTVRLIDSTELRPRLRLNTHRTGSTREFDGEHYNRPKFLASPEIDLPPGEVVRVISPYGGTLQLVIDPSEADSSVQLELGGVGAHPVLEVGTDGSGYLAELQDSPYPTTEITSPYVQVHSKTDMMIEAIQAYSGDLEAFLSDIQRYMVRDTYELAGFVGKGLSRRAEVDTTCAELGWDCDDPAIHGRPAVQHINVDYYAHCGGGCSGNPYDQSWALGPLGWGETHEIGHNLQRSLLDLYGWQSSEVSNQIFPLHKHWSWKRDTGESLSPERVSYEGVCELMQTAALSMTPFNVVYEAIWSDEAYAANNGERMALWMQMRHFAESLGRWDSGWDIFTLIYLHERLFTEARASNDLSPGTLASLGLASYDDVEAIDGNDFLLLSYSFITERDQRPLWDLFGVSWSSEADNQIEAYGFPTVDRAVWVSSDVNGEPGTPPVPIDGTSSCTH